MLFPFLNQIIAIDGKIQHNKQSRSTVHVRVSGPLGDQTQKHRAPSDSQVECGKQSTVCRSPAMGRDPPPLLLHIL